MAIRFESKMERGMAAQAQGGHPAIPKATLVWPPSPQTQTSFFSVQMASRAQKAKLKIAFQGIDKIQPDS